MLRAAVSVAVVLTASAQASGSAWNFTADGKVRSSPSSVDGRLFFGTERGTIYALSGDGALQWKLALPECRSDPATVLKVNCAPAISPDGTLYFRGRYFKEYTYSECDGVDGNAVLYAFRKDGTMKWNYTYQEIFDIGEQQECAAISKEGTVYIESNIPGTYNGMVHAINPDGSAKWNHTFATWLRGTPVLGAAGALHTWGWYEVFTLDSIGSLKWSFKWGSTLSDVCCQPKGPAVASDGTIYVSPYQKTTYAISAEGVSTWNFTSESTASHIPALGVDGTVYVADYEYLYALNSAGSLKWSYATGGMLGPTTVGTDGVVYVGPEAQGWIRLLAVDTNGKMLWDGNLRHGVSTRPTVSSAGSIYVAGEQVLAVPSFSLAEPSYLAV